VTRSLAAARKLSRAARAAESLAPPVDPLLVLAETLARELDDAVSGGQPGYVLSKLAASYCNVLQLLSQLLAPAGDDAVSAFLRSLETPSTERAGGLGFDDAHAGGSAGERY